MLPPHMDSTCHIGRSWTGCRNRDCPEAVKQDPTTKRWFITLGHSGFNSPANNRGGYLNENTARSSFRMYAQRGLEAQSDVR